jgi:hypothetical protein
MKASPKMARAIYKEVVKNISLFPLALQNEERD